MIDGDHENLSVREQTNLLGVNRSGIYYKKKPLAPWEFQLNTLIDRWHTAQPTYGYRRIGSHIRAYGGNVGIASANIPEIKTLQVSDETVRQRMRKMGITAIYPKPKTSDPNSSHKIYPYLLNGLQIERPNHVWSADISYLPIQSSWLYIVAIIDWYSRYILDWQLSDSLEIDFVLACAKNALQIASPEISNSDQGSHFTSPKYTGLFTEANAKISMDHQGRALDNIFIERFWRTLKYEDVYIHHYETPREARQGISEFVDHYNNVRLHQALEAQTPKAVYHGQYVLKGECIKKRCR